MKEIDDAYKSFVDNITTNKLSESTKRIIIELQKLNRNELYVLIEELKQGKFDDYHVGAYAFPKMELVDRLRALEIWGLATDIQMGLFD